MGENNFTVGYLWRWGKNLFADRKRQFQKTVFSFPSPLWVVSDFKWLKVRNATERFFLANFVHPLAITWHSEEAFQYGYACFILAAFLEFRIDSTLQMDSIFRSACFFEGLVLCMHRWNPYLCWRVLLTRRVCKMSVRSYGLWKELPIFKLFCSFKFTYQFCTEVCFYWALLRRRKSLQDLKTPSDCAQCRRCYS